MDNDTLLSNKCVRLRALEPDDIDFLLENENDTNVWEVSGTLMPFSRYILMKYIENSAGDIFESRQLRLMIDSAQVQKTVGMIDLFDYDPYNQRAGVGILIAPGHQKKYYARESLELLKKFAFEHLCLHQLYCNIGAENIASLNLFMKAGFKVAGVKKGWAKTVKGFCDEYLLQLIAPKHK